MKHSRIEFDIDALNTLTHKQREVLDLLLEHKTSKEIAQALEISPYTVDQRISGAKKKLVCSSRSALANRYRQLTQIYDQTAYEESRVSDLSDVPQVSQQDERVDVLEPDRIDPDPQEAQSQSYRLVPELFDGRYGRLIRVGAILVLAAALLIVALGGLATFAQLVEILDSTGSTIPRT